MMYNTFNMGLGMVLAVDAADVEKTMEAITATGDTPYVVGKIEAEKKEYFILRLVVMVSGGGTNLQAIIDRVEDGMITNAELVGVISNNANAYALERAKRHSIPACCISPKEFDSRDIFNEKLLETVDAYEPDLIVLAGFLVVIPPAMIEKYRNRMINIHPSLDPIFLRKRILWIERYMRQRWNAR